MITMLRVCVSFGLLFTVLFASAAPAGAQTSTGGLRGVVKDESGGVLVGVTVEASSPARIGGAAVEITDAEGIYRFENLPLGTYTVTFTLQGFSTLRREGIRIEVGRSLELPGTMAVGAVEQSITVTGDAPVVDAVHSGYTSNFNQQLLENVPSTRTSWFDVVTAAPAVRSDPVSANSATFLLYGSSGDQNSYQNDGVEVAAPSGGTVWSFPNPDTIQEVQVVGVGASAEYSGFQGGVVNIVTKSGSNKIVGIGQLLLRRRSADREQHARRRVSVQHRLSARCDVLLRRSGEAGSVVGARHDGIDRQPQLGYRGRSGVGSQESQLQTVRQGHLQARCARHR